jgi:hypothetical protein
MSLTGTVPNVLPMTGTETHKRPWLHRHRAVFENTKTRYWVASVLVDCTDPDGAAIHHIEAYSGCMTERRPVLHLDGAVEMNGGPVEFKRR